MEKRKKIPLRDRVIRLFIAFAIALVLWFLVNGSSDMIITQEFTSIPIVLSNAGELSSKNLVLAEKKNYYLNLAVRGTDRNLREINAKEVTAEANLGAIDAKGTYDLEIAVKGLSNSVIISSMNPSSLQITVDNIIKENLDVSVVVEGKPANDLAVISAKSLEEVEVKGPEESIARIDKIIGTANVNGMESDTVQHLEVLAYDDAGNQINDLDFSPNIIKADLILGKTKTVSVVPNIVGKPSDGYVITETLMEPSKVVIGAKESEINKITSVSMDPVDVSRYSKTFTQDVNLVSPEGFYLPEGGNKAKMTVNIESVIEKSITLDKVNAINVGAGLVASKIKETKVVVKLEGASSALNALNPGEAQAFVNCENLGMGEHELPIQTSFPKELVKSITPQKTTLTLDK